MALISMLRTQLRYTSGQRPRVEDLEQIVSYMRQRRARGLDPVPWRLFGTLRGWGRPDPGRVKARQARSLRQTVEYVYRYMPFYREALDAAGVNPADIRSQADVRKLPITRKEQLCENTEAFISRYPGLAPTTIASTSGTSGKPMRVYLGAEEMRYWVASGAMRNLISGRLGPADIVQTHRNLNGSAGGLVSAMTARMSGALVLTFGGRGTLDEHLDSIFQERYIPGKKPKVSVLSTFPSHVWALTYRAVERGFDFGDSGLERITAGGAMVSEDLKQRVLETWGIRLDEGYGLNDVFTCGASQCGESDRLHWPDSSGYAEVLDPETAEPVPPGEPGVLAITSFYPHRQLTPLLRYWTGDLVMLSPDPLCVCGAATTQILDILGRADHVVVVGGNNYYPHTIGDSLLAFPELAMPPRFTLRTEQGEDAQYAILDVEVSDSLSDDEKHELRQQIEKGIILSRNWEVSAGSVKLVINLQPPGSIEHPFPYKLQEGSGPTPWAQ
jgi:phenylacetate-CoA ligase